MTQILTIKDLSQNRVSLGWRLDFIGKSTKSAHIQLLISHLQEWRLDFAIVVWIGAWMALGFGVLTLNFRSY